MYIYLNKICDVFCKNLPYGGTNILGPDQTPRTTRAYDIFCSWTPTANIFVAPYAGSTIMNIITIVWTRLILEEIVCSSIRQVFAEDVTNIEKCFQFVPELLEGIVHVCLTHCNLSGNLHIYPREIDRPRTTVLLIQIIYNNVSMFYGQLCHNKMIWFNWLGYSTKNTYLYLTYMSRRTTGLRCRLRRF